MDQLAEAYVRLVLDIGQYDGDFIDAYYGPETLKPSGAKEDTFPDARFINACQELEQRWEGVDTDAFDDMQLSRHRAMTKQLRAVKTKVEMMAGQSFDFDKEAQLLYDAQPPHDDTTYFNALLKDLDQELPGTASLSECYENFSKQFIIPVEKLDAVFQIAITEARKRTLQHYALPAEESFTIEYVKDKAWSGYNYYKGNSYSLIQINTDFPIYIERAIDLACHEGYPGHHVFNALLEKNLVKERGWIEYSVYPLFSPQSLIAEGSANYGIDVAFPGQERVIFEREQLFPAAGMDPGLAEKYHRIQKLRGRLNYAGNEAARAYLNGDIDRNQAASWLEKYLLYEPDRAMQRTRFIDQYRSYVINYNLGLDLVADYIKQQGGTVDDPEKRWLLFEKLLSTPHTASDLQWVINR